MSFPLLPTLPRIATLTVAALALLLASCASQNGGAEHEAGPGASAADSRPAERETPLSIDEAIDLFASDYAARLGEVEVKRRAIPGGEEITLTSPKLKGPGNEPQLLIHSGGRTENVLVLCHGLSDSPHYMRAIGDVLFEAGANIVLPLLPAHGLVDPDKAMEDADLDKKWIATFDNAVTVAEQLGDRVSLGGFSTGGTLSVHKALSEPERINGALFLFAAALHVGSVNENLAWSAFLVPQIAKWQDGTYEGRGPNPYKYPAFPQFGGLELIDVIHDINRMLDEGASPPQPIFAAHSIHDAAAMPKGVGHLLRAEDVRGVAIVVASNPPLEHARLTLAEDIALDPAYIEEGDDPPVPRAFPGFDRMMDLVLNFYGQLPRHAPLDGTALADEASTKP